MKRIFVAPILGVLLAGVPSTLAQTRPSASAKRLSVLDYYFLLPGIGTSGYPTRRERQSLLQTTDEAFTKPVIDLHNDYLSVKPDSAPREQIAVFRGNGADLIAQSAPDYQSDYNGFCFYHLVNGTLRDVTKQVLPVPLNPNRFLLELPRVGTTIHVFSFKFETQSRKPVFDLLWRRGHFVIAKLKR